MSKVGKMLRLAVLGLFIATLLLAFLKFKVLEVRLNPETLGRIVSSEVELSNKTAEYLMDPGLRALDLLTLAFAVLASGFGVFMGLRNME